MHRSMEPTVRATCRRTPIRGFGYTCVLGASPDLAEGARLQAGNDASPRKIEPKSSREISSNLLGATPPRMPRTPQADHQPLLSVHLTDGDPETCWCSRGEPRPDVEPVWIRVDLPREMPIAGVVLRKRPSGAARREPVGGSVRPREGAVEAGMAMPARLEVRLSRDAWHWTTVHQSADRLPEEELACAISFAPQPAKQVWILGWDLPQVENFGHCFSIGEIEVLDDRGVNVALASRGAGVTVSSTHYGLGDEREAHEALWPLHWDLGLKWVRVGYHDDPVNWHWVEREKGVYHVDPRADAAVTECIENGIEVVVCLAFGNWLYTPQGRRKWGHLLWEWYYDCAPPPVSAEAQEAWLRFVRFLVGHFRGRVRYWEIWNEWNGGAYWGVEPNVADYIALAKATIPVVREACPEAKIMLGSLAGWWGAGGKGAEMHEQAIRALAREVDVIGYHPFYQTDAEERVFREYVGDFARFRQVCESAGFRGDYMATEFTWSAPYPSPEDSRLVVSEMQKAKYLAQLTVKHTAMGVASFWNETWQGHMTRWDVGLLRNSFSADPHSPRQPQPAYYVMRTLATALDQLRAAAFPVQVDPADAALELFTFERPGERVVALWVPGRARDVSADTRVDLVLPDCEARQAVGLDVMNGTEQDLRIESRGGAVLIPGILAKDYPLLIRLPGSGAG